MENLNKHITGIFSHYRIYLASVSQKSIDYKLETILHYNFSDYFLKQLTSSNRFPIESIVIKNKYGE